MTDVTSDTVTTKRYEDFTDEDVADVLASREEARKASKTEIPAGTFFSRVKVQRDSKRQPTKGIFAGAAHITLGLVPFTNPDDSSSELKNGIVWHDLALPVANPGQKMSAQARSIAINNMQALGLVARTDDEMTDVKNAIELAKQILDGSATMIGATAYTEVSYNDYINGKGEARKDTNVRYYSKLAKGKTLTQLQVS